jgi:hypothetical protein
MNQHSRRGGQANGNSVDEVRRGATRPAAVVAIVLCVGFAVAMVAIWQFRKPPSHQKMQTQPEAAVQTEIPKTEAVSPVSVPDRDVLLEPPAATPVSQASPAAPSTAMPVSQANPAAGWGNSPAPVQDDNDNDYDFSHHLNQETITFEGVNPTTKVPGFITVTITGVFGGNYLGDEQSPAGSHLQANQQATFSFVPYDRYSPSYSATVNTLQLAGNTTDDSISFNFGLDTTGSDGSSQRFMLREVVTVTEDGAKVAFEQR